MFCWYLWAWYALNNFLHIDSEVLTPTLMLYRQQSSIGLFIYNLELQILNSWQRNTASARCFDSAVIRFRPSLQSQFTWSCDNSLKTLLDVAYMSTTYSRRSMWKYYSLIRFLSFIQLNFDNLQFSHWPDYFWIANIKHMELSRWFCKHDSITSPRVLIDTRAYAARRPTWTSVLFGSV